MKNKNFKNSYYKYMKNIHIKEKTLLLCLIIAISINAIPNYSYGNNMGNFTNSLNMTNNEDNKIISGIIVDIANIPLPGVSISIEGLAKGTISDIDGRYTLSVQKNTTLIFSFVGYITQKVKVVNQDIINIQLIEDNQQLNEVIVVGYGVQRKSDVVGSISVTTAEEMLATPAFNALDGLKGKIAGVTIFNNTGNPLGIDESAAKVIIRGMNSINTSTDPLYVVDGVQMGDIQFINPNDIERMEVLKDASATAIYGARGANGVILVTTKRGKSGHQGIAVSYNGWISLSTLANKIDVMNSKEFMEMQDIAFANIGKYEQGRKALESLGVTELFVDRSDPLIFDANGNPLYDTDWQEVGTRKSISHSHQLNIQQQNEKSSVGAFFNYTDKQGLLHNNFAKRINAKLTFDTKPKKWLDINSNIMVNHMWGNGIDDTGGGQTARRTMWELPPILPVKFPNGSYSNSQYEGSMLNFGLEGMSNPLDELNNRKRNRYRTKLFGNLAFVFHIIDGLDLRTQLGVDANFKQNKNFTPNNLKDISSRGEAEFYNGQDIYWQEETYLSYNKLIKDIHRINATLGASWSKYSYYENSTGTVYDFDNNALGYDNIQAGKTPTAPSSNFHSWTMNSYFGRASYSYADKYLLTTTFRIDGSSRFGNNNKYGFFPSAGLGWVVSNENFMSKTSSWLDNLKIRASYGRTGNTELSVYQTLSTMNSSTTILNGDRIATNQMIRLANPDLKWEKTDQFDIGFNLNLFNYRVNLEVDYYVKNTRDLLLARPLPFTTGFENVMDNIGQVENQGIDFMLNTVNINTKEFRWESILNFNYNKNKIKELGQNNEDIILNPDIQGGNTILRVGESMGSFYGYLRYGTWGTNEVDEAAKAGAIPGEAKRSTDRHIIGKGLPDWTGSFINKLYYKNFDFTLDLQFVMGVDVWQQFLHPMEDRAGIANGLKTVLYNSWTEQRQNTMVQQIRQQNYAGQNSMADSHWVCNGSYLRGNLIQLAYTFDNKMLKKWNINSLRLNVSVNNAFQIRSSNFKGYDPESTTFGDRFGQNIISYQYPSSRTYTFGVNFSF